MTRTSLVGQILTSLSLCLLSLFSVSVSCSENESLKPKLEIHYINTGQGGSTLIIGPDGTTILYDFGVKKGEAGLVPYLDSVLNGRKEIDYAILSHRDRDHFMGYRGLIESGYRIRIANYEPDGPKKNSPLYLQSWKNVTKNTPAGLAKPIPVGLNIALGNGAYVLVAASNGHIFDGTVIDVTNENDRSIALFIDYGDFEFILDGDLGGGVEECSQHETTQKDVQTFVARALLNSGKISKEFGVDIFHVAHHGSESSSPARYLSLIKPKVGVISVGNPNCAYRHPRKDVMSLLHGQNLSSSGACSEVTPLTHVFQTDYGSENCLLQTVGTETSNTGIISGDIVISTDGMDFYRIKTSGILWVKGERIAVLNERVFILSTE